MQFSSPIFVGSKVLVLYERKDALRKHAFVLEDKFGEKFLPPEVLPIPDEAPLEIPRVIFRSKNGHSTLNITPIRSELVTSYDDEFNLNFDKCFAYIKEKSGCLVDLIEQVGIEILGLGFFITLRWPSLDESEEILADKMKLKILPNVFQDENCFDLGVNLSRVVNDELFLNTRINNFRLYGSNTPIFSPYPKLSDLKLLQYGMEVNFEVNNKYIYDKGGTSRGMEDLDRFVELIANEIQNIKAKFIGGMSDAK